MSQKRLDDRLHLPSLSIKGFRGIKELSIERLGRVTLLAGKNSVGKTTVLDAVQVYAARGHHEVLSELLASRQEVSAATAPYKGKITVPDFVALLHGRDVSRLACISIGLKNGTDQFRIEGESLSGTQGGYVVDGYQGFKVVFQDTEQILPWLIPIQRLAVSRTVERYSNSAYRYIEDLFREAESPPQIGCRFLGPDLLSNQEFARSWDAIALTDDEDRSVQALRLIFGSDLERVAVLGDNEGLPRRIVVKLRRQARPVPLKSLGDGALRLFSVALALANSRDSFLLIDEAENGIHHSVQPDFWRMVFKTAHENNVQVIATTHSFDCVRGFAQAAVECEEVEGALVRIERKDEEMWAVEYSERDLRIAAEQRIEVR